MYNSAWFFRGESSSDQATQSAVLYSVRDLWKGYAVKHNYLN